MAGKIKLPSFVTWLLQKLKSMILDSDGLTFRETVWDGESCYILQDYGHATLQRDNAHGKPVPVVAIRDAFWMYASIGFSMVGKKKISVSNISFQFFDIDRLLFRAEWSEKPQVDMVHPQPHWHFHPYYEENEGFVEQESKNFEESLGSDGFLASVIKSQKIRKIDISDMHLTMDYHIASNPYENKWDDQRIKKWVDETINTIFGELDFVIRKGHLV